MSLLQSIYLTFLKTCTKLQLAKYHPQIIGITGSAGKSSAVLATYLTVSATHQNTVQYSKKGNSETGIPFEVLQIPVENYQGINWIYPIILSFWHLLMYWPKYEYLILEMGIDSQFKPKNMEYQLEFIQPTIGALLNVSSVHGANFTGPDIVQSIANEKRKLLTALPATGLAVFSADHPQITKNISQIKAPQRTFSLGTNPDADVSLLSYEVNLKGTTYSFAYSEGKFQLHFANQLHTRAAFGSFATALLIGEKCGTSIAEGISALQHSFILPPGRMSLLSGVTDTTLIDSSYNSSPEATASALEMLAALKISGQKIAVLGDMRELGTETEKAHVQLADEAAKVADILIWVGPLTEKYCYQTIKKTHPKKINLAFTSAWEAILPLKELLKKNDLILIKGSQNTILLEIIVEALLKNPDRDRQLLCRRSEYWENQRQLLKKL